MSFLSTLFPCFRDDPPPSVTRTPNNPSNPWTIGPIVNGVNYSAGMPAQPTANGDGTFSFDIPQDKPGVHGVTRPASESGRSQITLRFSVATAADFLEVDAPDGNPLPGAVSLFLQRSGDDWGGPNSGKSSYRFYSQPFVLVPGEHTLAVTLSPEAWTNVDGQQDAAGFAAALADLATVGIGFGRRFAMHGVIATGPARFTIHEYTLT